MPSISAFLWKKPKPFKPERRCLLSKHMPYTPFHERFLKIAQEETRTLVAVDAPGLPPGEYGLTEAYCDEPGCDCRRVFFNVVDWRTGQVKAVIAYGWESAQFYAKWFGRDDPEMIHTLQGPILNWSSSQSELAPALLAQMPLILSDKTYVERLKRHYRMFKAAIENEAPPQRTMHKAKPKKAVRQKKKTGGRQ